MKVFLDTNIVLDYFSGRMGDTLAESQPPTSKTLSK